MLMGRSTGWYYPCSSHGFEFNEHAAVYFARGFAQLPQRRSM
jgi:hypothetical protein